MSSNDILQLFRAKVNRVVRIRFVFNGNLLDATVLELSAWANIIAITKEQKVV